MNRALGEGVLYHAVSSYQLLEAMLHRRLFHREERATLLLPDFIVGKYPQWQRLERRASSTGCPVPLSPDPPRGGMPGPTEPAAACRAWACPRRRASPSGM